MEVKQKKLSVSEAEVGKIYDTVNGAKVKIVKIVGSGDSAVVTVDYMARGKRQRVEAPGSQRVLVPVAQPAPTAPANPAEAPETSDVEAEAPPNGRPSKAAPVAPKAAPKTPVKAAPTPAAKSAAHKPKAKQKAAAKTTRAGETYQKVTKPNTERWWKKSVAEVKAALAEKKKKNPKPPELTYRWFILEQFMTKPGTAETIAERVRAAYKCTVAVAMREVYRHIYLEGKRVTRKETDGKGKPTLYGYAK